MTQQIVPPPPRWPPKLAMALGVVCVTACGIVSVIASGASDSAAAAEAQMEQVVADGAGDAAQRGVVRGVRRARIEAASWRRRQLGLALTGSVLLIGGFVASGLRRLYDKIAWAEIDESGS